MYETQGNQEVVYLVDYNGAKINTKGVCVCMCVRVCSYKIV